VHEVQLLSACLVQIVVWKYLYRSGRVEVLETKTLLLRIVILQYFPRFIRFLPLASEVKKTAGVFSENALLGAMYYLIWYMLASHVSVHVIKQSFFPSSQANQFMFEENLLIYEVKSSFF